MADQLQVARRRTDSSGYSLEEEGMSEGEGCLEVVNVEGVERFLRERLAALDRVQRAELLHVLMLPDHDRAGRLHESLGNSKTRSLGELLLDAEQDPYMRAVLVAVLRDAPP